MLQNPSGEMYQYGEIEGNRAKVSIKDMANSNTNKLDPNWMNSYI